jgi:hypothetical protein
MQWLLQEVLGAYCLGVVISSRFAKVSLTNTIFSRMTEGPQIYHLGTALLPSEVVSL